MRTLTLALKMVVDIYKHTDARCDQQATPLHLAIAFSHSGSHGTIDRCTLSSVHQANLEAQISMLITRLAQLGVPKLKNPTFLQIIPLECHSPRLHWVSVRRSDVPFVPCPRVWDMSHLSRDAGVKIVWDK